MKLQVTKLRVFKVYGSISKWVFYIYIYIYIFILVYGNRGTCLKISEQNMDKQGDSNISEKTHSCSLGNI
jgi:hypothetical protein